MTKKSKHVEVSSRIESLYASTVSELYTGFNKPVVFCSEVKHCIRVTLHLVFRNDSIIVLFFCNSKVSKAGSENME